MRCATAQNLLPLYLDSQLKGQEARELECHLEGCRSCSRLIEQLEASPLLIPSLPRPLVKEVMRSLDVALEKEIEHRRTVPLTPPSLSQRYLPSAVRWAGTGAVLGCALTIGFMQRSELLVALQQRTGTASPRLLTASISQDGSGGDMTSAWDGEYYDTSTDAEMRETDIAPSGPDVFVMGAGYFAPSNMDNLLLEVGTVRTAAAWQ